MYFNGTKCCALIFCCFLSLSLVAKDVKTMNAKGLQKPLCFVENKGQVTDQENNPRKDINYKLSTPGMSLYIGKGQLHYQFRKVEGNTSSLPKVSGYQMDVTLMGANPKAKVIAAEQQGYYENYFLAQNKDALTVHSFNKIIYKDIYPGIDWVLYVKNSQVEYDFIVRPGGNVDDIKIQYDGATALSITKDGGISAETPMGIINEKSPYSYETESGKAVASNFVLHNNIISFKTGAYNGSITIDPFLLWSTYFGGTAEDVVTSVKENAFGETYAGGYTASSGLGTAGVYQQPYGGATYEAFLTKYDPFGSLIFTTYLGNTGAGKITRCTGIAIDNTGASIYIAGYTNSAGFVAPKVAYNALNDGFVVRINNTGSVLSWSTFFGGTKDDYIDAIAIDAGNNVYITGQTASNTGIAAGAIAPYNNLQGLNDAFVAKINGLTGVKAWGTYYGGTAQEEGFGIALDASNNVFITGQTNSIINIATTGAHQTSLLGTNDAFIAKWNSTGTSLLWGTYFGGTQQEQGNSLVCNQATGEIAVIGNTTSPDNIAGFKAYQSVYAGGPQDAFVTYLNGAGNLLWSTYYGGSQPEYGQGICLDNNNNIVITGATFSASGIIYPSAHQPIIGGDYDAYLAKFTTKGQVLWSTYFGGIYYEYGNAVACDNNNQLTLGGFTTSTGLYGTGGITTAGAAQTLNAGGTYDGFVTKFSIDTFLQISKPFLDTTVCAGGTFFVSYTSNFDFQPDNIFTVELSDITGSFAAPVFIGSAPSIPFTTSGTISCVIPSGTTIGKGYRIRIVATDPGYTSPDNFYDIEVKSSIPAATPSGTTPVCIANYITLDVTAPYLLTGFSWTGPAGSGLSGLGFTSALQNPTNGGFFGSGITKADSGIYTVVTSHNGCPDQTSTINIVVNDFTLPVPTLSSSPYGCVGSGISLFANPDTTLPGITYSWTGTEGFISTLQNPVTPKVTLPGTHIYSLADHYGGCSFSNTIVVNVNDTTHVSVSITALPGDTICRGTMVNFKAIPVNGGVSTHYQWMSGVGIPISGAVSDVFSSSSLLDGETIFCTMNSSILCPSPISAPSNVIKMNVISNPPVVKIFSSANYVKSGDSITFTSAIYNGGTAPLYQWLLNGKNIPGANSSTYVLHNVTKPYTISLQLTSTMMCAVPDFGISDPIIVGTNVGVANISSSLENIDLFPNPNTGSFTIRGDYQNSNTKNVSIEILNLAGLIIYKDNTTVQNNAINKTVDIKNIPDGIYILRLSDEGQSKTLHFSVSR